ncbi:glycosyltransferase (plasmid) [Acetobacter orientalis]|uniref:glycosyltransferase n=1 Tax=Acetobacter orientalis TaxID=146474 RepID=UPI0038703831
MHLAILSIGMSEKNDSVCNDVAFNYRILSSQHPTLGKVRVFSGNYDPSAFPDIPVESAAAFEEWLTHDPDVVVLFHYCDSRSPFDDFLRNHCRRVIVRWHNATPPWFTFGVQNQNANHALLGYENIIDFIDCGHVSFWTNSGFTRDQLVALGAAPERCHVVFPASRYLNLPALSPLKAPEEKKPKDAIDLLFVSRVVAHKGHLNAIAVADRTQEITGRRVRLNIVGKGLDEPSAFSMRLRQAIKLAKAEIVVHGLVSDDALVHLYQTSDVFICLSEHEGFGLPVFEAMRYRLPVVAWATTAFRELLVDHPFAFPNFDLDLFAASIGALDEEGVKDRLLEIQYAVLQTYSAPILHTQIFGALAAQESSWGQPIPDDLGRPAIRYLPHTASTIDRARNSLHKQGSRGFDDALIFDSHVNLTSLHDLRMFKDYLQQDKALIYALTAPVREPSVTFRPDEFSIRQGVSMGPLEFGASPPASVDVRADHLIFGPYVQMPAGQYRALLDITVQIESTASVPFEIDVNSGGKQLISSIVTLAPGSHSLDEPVIFDLVGEAPMVEIRLRAVDPFRGCVVFSGVTLVQTNAALPSAVVTLETRAVPHLLDRLLQLGPLARLSRERQAKAWFRKGNAARDNGDWTEAARLYDMGLNLAPGRYAYIVQSGHMYKEAGDFETAHVRYSQAFSLKPDDADLCLQIGHFYKRSGDPKTAQTFYLKALSSYGATAFDAGVELLSLAHL